MRFSAPIFNLKRQAKLLARRQGIPLSQALDRVASAEGFRSWSHLASMSSTLRTADRILDTLRAGDMLLLGARPGHGKTLLGLELAVSAPRLGRTGVFFTLDYNERDVLDRLATIDVERSNAAASVIVDTSDDICADYMIERLGRVADDALVVIDYLQVLDQKRSTPDLATQVQALRSYAETRGSIIVMISQIDRAFELTGKPVPDLTDVRLPNPLDLTLFGKTCFLHQGEIRLKTAA